MVLSKGASERSAKVLRAYLQREPKMDAFLEEMGLRQWAVCLRSESECVLLCGVWRADCWKRWSEGMVHFARKARVRDGDREVI